MRVKYDEVGRVEEAISDRYENLLRISDNLYNESRDFLGWFPSGYLNDFEGGAKKNLERLIDALREFNKTVEELNRDKESA